MSRTHDEIANEVAEKIIAETLPTVKIDPTQLAALIALALQIIQTIFGIFHPPVPPVPPAQ